ncbi:uncharacterized protein DSM5745_01247 [Aspergillus mulundensis]|uniref:Cytochrome b5 heme-binding domain-containing protein n=1 Tax=Aspergillus mulundensis TaxID=1810919 RepID=A0A3D8T5U5_9EURO|nr:Uncharacterized protein DSM5745_01247 [Aspergillus mulundensis]RDW93925.1 Uncharacterized protein DSM5745_01247 [Aspergillus mulundensis]
MGWVGVAIVVATTCFLLYRHPPASWFPEPPVAHQARRESTPERKERKANNEESSYNIERTSQLAAAKDEPVEETQTTPKASASPAPTPVLDVPSFQLDDDDTDKGTAQKAQQDTAQQPTSPSPNPSPSLATPAPSITMAPPSSTPKQPQPPVTNDASLMPPPPPPSRLQPPSLQNQRRPQPQTSLAPPPGRFPPPRPSSGARTLGPPPSAASSLRVPPGMRPGASTTSNSLSPNKVTLTPAKKASQRAVLEPGFSPLDWAALTSNPNHKLRGANLPNTLIKVTPSMLKVQNGRKGTDAWTSYQGKVYNISPYLPFHPGGKGELLRGAGKDSGKLFLEIHPWVNWDAILGECLVGILVSEHEAVEENKLDAMD